MDSPNIWTVDFALSGTKIHLYIPTDLEHCHKWTAGHHCNAEYEVHIILSGNCEVMLNDTARFLCAPNAILICPKFFHSPNQVSDNFCRLSFNFTLENGPLADQLSQVDGFSLCTLPPQAIAICQDVLTELTGEIPFREDALVALFMQLLVQLFRAVQMGQYHPDSQDSASSSLRTATIDKFFSPFPHSFGTQENLAQMLHMSRRHLNRILQQCYGMSFREKMLQSRMEAAGWLLMTTDKKISEIGTMVGYTAESSFFKTFRSYYKMTPQEYRKKHTGIEN